MNIGYIFLIIGASLIGFIALLFLFGRISSSNKKLTSLKKKTASVSREMPTEPAEAKPQVDYNRPEKAKGAIITSYEDFNDDDKKELNAQRDNSFQSQPENKRKSFEEIMRTRDHMKANSQSQEQISQEDDFEHFRDQHSAYITYRKDEELISQIKGLSPQARRVLFSNLFQRIDHD